MPWKRTLGMVNFPPLSVVAVRLKPLTGLRISTLAFGTTAPVTSTTVPVTDVELPPDCALALGSRDRERMNRKAANSGFLYKASMIPPKKVQEIGNGARVGSTLSIRSFEFDF